MSNIAADGLSYRSRNRHQGVLVGMRASLAPSLTRPRVRSRAERCELQPILARSREEKCLFSMLLIMASLPTRRAGPSMGKTGVQQDGANRAKPGAAPIAPLPSPEAKAWLAPAPSPPISVGHRIAV